ncbi:MAG: hypothetical protein M0R80_02925 [Proteobacteria bacterium]|jgi:hypothetical protein|nr:hypothetical protein [Pseudomonadota bacterium]
MPEEAFRPQRKPISPDEIKSDQNALNEISQVRRAVEEELETSPASPAQLPITGKIPPFAQKILDQQLKGPQRRPEAMSEEPLDGGDAFQQMRARIKQSKATFEEIELPSKGKFYDGTDGPRNGKLHIRPMTGQEEEILATSRFVKKGKAMNMIFNHCIQEDYDAEKFLTEDRTYLLIYLRGISYTPQYDVEVKCPGCDRRFGHVIDLNGLYVDACPADFDANSLKDQTPQTSIPFTYRLSRGEDEQRVQDYRERKGKNTTGTDDTLLYRSSLLVENLGGCTEKREILQLLKEMHINDVAHIRNTIAEPPFGVDTSVDIYCPGCLEEFTIDLPLEADFFFPRKRKKGNKMENEEE